MNTKVEHVGVGASGTARTTSALPRSNSLWIHSARCVSKHSVGQLKAFRHEKIDLPPSEKGNIAS